MLISTALLFFCQSPLSHVVIVFILRRDSGEKTGMPPPCCIPIMINTVFRLQFFENLESSPMTCIDVKVLYNCFASDMWPLFLHSRT